MKAILASYNFHPGHVSHMLANFKLLTENGFDVSFNCHKKYENYLLVDKLNREKVCGLTENDFLIVWFPSTRALIDMLMARILTKGTVVYVFHEPFDSIMSYFSSGFGVAKTMKIVLASLVNGLLVKCAHKIVLPSDRAFEVFKLKYRFIGEFARVPLMFDDEAQSVLSLDERQYISYIGTVAPDHDFDGFVEFIVYCLELNLFPKYTFLVATKSLLDNKTLRVLRQFMGDGRLEIVSGLPMSNDEINQYFSRSIAVWNAYRRSMQSGVLPKAYMFGTPVVASESNQSEYFVDGQTGVELTAGFSSSDVCVAMNLILDDFFHYSQRARNTFLEHFYYKAIADDYLTFINKKYV